MASFEFQVNGTVNLKASKVSVSKDYIIEEEIGSVDIETNHFLYIPTIRLAVAYTSSVESKTKKAIEIFFNKLETL